MMTTQSFLKQSRWKKTLLITLVGWIPKRPGKKLRNILYPTIFAHFGNHTDLDYGIEFLHSYQIEIGNYVRLHRDVRLMCSPFKSKIRLQNRVHLDRGVDIRIHQQGEIEIGENTYIGPYTCLSGNNIKIGNSCLIASHSGIYANNHIFADPNCKIVTQGNSYKGIVIEDDCWLGSGVKVLDGVTIGEGSIVGANAVVTKNIPPYSIAVGAPAKVIAKRDGSQISAKTLSANHTTSLV